jgi:hypothetical protein
MNIIGNLPAAARAITMVLVTALLTRVAQMRTTFWAPLPDIDTTNYNRGLDSFEKDKCWNFFRFRKVDLPRLIVLLQIPPFLILKGDKNGQVSGAFAFLILCYRLLYDTRELYQTDNLEEFGCDYSKLDKIFNCCLDYLYDLHKHKILFNIEWYADRFDMYHTAITNKLLRMPAFNNVLPIQLSNLMGFIENERVTVRMLP